MDNATLSHLIVKQNKIKFILFERADLSNFKIIEKRKRQKRLKALRNFLN